MDIANIQNNVNNLNNISHQSLDRSDNVQKSEAINSDDDALVLNISEIYSQKSNELSDTLQNTNEGLMATTIAKKGLQAQEDVLKSIQKSLNTISEDKNNEIDMNQLKSDISQNLQRFTDIAQSTKYKDTQILITQDSNINITSNNKTFAIEPANTQQVASSLFNGLTGNNLESAEDVESASNEIQTAINSIRNLNGNFNQVEKDLQNNAKEAIEKQINHSLEQSKIRDIDFGQEVADFSKTNITSHMGYLAASQANIVQEQSVKLIAK